jgi:hypothetical protein
VGCHRFGEDCRETNLLDERFGPINTSWAVLLYLLCVIGYLVFLVCPDPFLTQDDAFAIQVIPDEMMVRQDVHKPSSLT